mmetsp:Transcript_30948/g.63703  ORF Transcript_30948/g.63703 Transcript_30948/m.63703 type:complete len:154 (-) Transcript_30948:156-617(-)
MASAWQPPYWSHPPASTDTWTLDEIKQGNIIASYSLNEILTKNHPSRRGAAVTFGRIDDPSAVDIVTAHESCSRLHARISFDKSGVEMAHLSIGGDCQRKPAGKWKFRRGQLRRQRREAGGSFCTPEMLFSSELLRDCIVWRGLLSLNGAQSS